MRGPRVWCVFEWVHVFAFHRFHVGRLVVLVLSSVGVIHFARSSGVISRVRPYTTPVGFRDLFHGAGVVSLVSRVLQWAILVVFVYFTTRRPVRLLYFGASCGR